MKNFDDPDFTIIRPHDLGNYNTRMGKSILDKVFFLDKVFGIDCIVDYGCANGELLRFCKTFNPDFTYIGFDIDPEMVGEAVKESNGILYTTDWEQVKTWAKGRKVLLNCSSLIHEVYSYATGKKSIDIFWNNVFSLNPEYISIRDFMIIPGRTSCPRNLDATLDMNPLWEKYKEHWHCSGSRRGGKYIKNAIHFLLKYRFTSNWDKEVKENYSPLDCDELEEIFHGYGYTDVFKKLYCLPFTRHQVKEDFGLDIETLGTTHMQYIFKR